MSLLILGWIKYSHSVANPDKQEMSTIRTCSEIHQLTSCL